MMRMDAIGTTQLQRCDTVKRIVCFTKDHIEKTAQLRNFVKTLCLSDVSVATMVTNEQEQLYGEISIDDMNSWAKSPLFTAASSISLVIYLYRSPLVVRHIPIVAILTRQLPSDRQIIASEQQAVPSASSCPPSAATPS